MAKKRAVTPKTPIDQDLVHAQRGKEFYDTVVDALANLKPAVFPVKFTDPRYEHLNGNLETGKGVFVRMMDLHEQDSLRDLAKEKNLKANSPVMVLQLAFKAACIFTGDLMFDKDSQFHQELLVKESGFTTDIWLEAMYVNGYYVRPESDVAKNSDETTNSDLE